MTEAAFCSQGVLHSAVDEDVLPAGKEGGAENSVERAGPEREIVTANAAFGQAILTLNVFLRQVARVASGKFDPAQRAPDERVVDAHFLIGDEVADERGVADAEL